MRLTIVNISNAVPQAEFLAAVSTVQKQVSQDFQPEWGAGAVLRGATLTLTGNKRAPIDGLHDAIIYVGTSHDDPNTGVQNALGYHADNYKGIPYGFVYLDIAKMANEVWTCTLSHEVLELLGDPSAQMTVSGPDPRGGAKLVRYD